jgi:hypothetical protein
VERYSAGCRSIGWQKNANLVSDVDDIAFFEAQFIRLRQGVIVRVEKRSEDVFEVSLELTLAAVYLYKALYTNVRPRGRHTTQVCDNMLMGRVVGYARYRVGAQAVEAPGEVAYFKC